MEFLAIVIALLCYQFWGSAGPLHEDAWFYRLQQRLAGWSPGPRLAVLVLLPVAVAQGLLNVLEHKLFGLPWIGLAAVLLLYAFGRGDFQELMGHYRKQCRSGDFAGAFLSTLPQLGHSGDAADPASPGEVHMLAQRGFFYLGYQRWFPVLFYFLVLGPAGALAYRLLQLQRDSDDSAITRRSLFLADWVPVRLLACSFALLGDFIGSRESLVDTAPDTSIAADQLLYSVGTAALDLAPLPDAPQASLGETFATQNEECGSLLSRSAACWLAVIAVAVLLG